MSLARSAALRRRAVRASLARRVTAWRRRAAVAAATALWDPAAGRPRPESRSQTGEDALLWDLLGGRANGFFVEAGAYDGYTFSVSYLFECAGWTGVLVEPLADRAAECARRRPGSRVVTAALSRPGTAGEATFTRVPWFELYSGFEPADPTFGFPGEDAAATVAETTPVVTLDSVLEGGEGPIDFVVLDVEGHELAVLEGFDLDRWRPSALLVEDNAAGGDRAVRRRLEGHGYAYLGSLEQNDLFVSRDEPALTRRIGRSWRFPGPLVRR